MGKITKASHVSRYIVVRKDKAGRLLERFLNPRENGNCEPLQCGKVRMQHKAVLWEKEPSRLRFSLATVHVNLSHWWCLELHSDAGL